MKYYGIYGIIQYLNKIQKQTTDSYVARVIYENRSVLNHTRIEHLAKKHGLSQASMSRFINKLGFSKYKDYQATFKDSLEFMNSI